MKEVEGKYFAFSEREFSVLACACGINSFLCFNPEQEREEIIKVDKRTYIGTIYQLFKRDIVKSDENELILKPEIYELFTPLRKSKFIIWYSCGYSEIIEGFLYLLNDDVFLSALPGKRKGEYIRLCLYKKMQVLQFLNSRILNEWNELREKVELIVFDGKTHNELIRIQWNNEKPDRLAVKENDNVKFIKFCWESILYELRKILKDKGEIDDTC